MYEDPKTLKMPVIPATVEQQMLASLIRIEGLLTGLLTSAETQIDGLRFITHALNVKSATEETPKRVGRNRS